MSGVRRQNVAPHLVVYNAQGVGAGFAVRLGGQRTPQNGLAHALFAARHQLAGDVPHRGAGGFEKHFHAAGNDARRILSQAAQGVEQRGLILFAAARRVLAQAQGQTMYLDILDFGAGGIGADQIGPGQHAEQARARQPARFAFVGMHQPAAGPQLHTVRAAVAQA